MSNVDDRIKELAQNNWEEFINLIGENAIVIAKSRLLRRDGKSYRQISLKLKLTQSQIRYACKDDKK